MTEPISPEAAIAVIGMAGRFPGARDLEQFWENLRQGVESISRLSAEELRAAGLDPAVLEDPSYVPAGGVLEGGDLFDAGLFQLSPREAELLDPQHRVFLETAWACLEDAGYDPARYPGAIGVYAGSSLNHYLLFNLLPRGDYPGAGGQALIASDKDFLTTRVSYKLNLRGPSLDVQTACSTSLVTIVLACQALLNYQCDLALAGGVSVREPQKSGYPYAEGGILSPDGHCRPFDAAARGTVPGNGVGAVVLKRLEDALADGDTIRAVIRGAALNNDGSAKVGYTAPSVAGQAEVIGMALAIAGVDPRDVTYVEAHGTATPIGDPIEVRALDKVFRGATEDKGFCALGAVKSNVGHLDAAAGVAGFIKTVLALERRQIPPTLHFQAPNPETGLADGPFYVNAELRDWETDRLPRRAGVSSFGVGGTNAHVVLEEAPKPEESADFGFPELLVLSARTPAALDAVTAQLARHLERSPDLRLADVAHTLRVGRRQLDARRFVVARDLEDAASVLADLDPARSGAALKPQGEREVVFLFPGQGAQHARMAGELYRAEPVFRAEVDAACEILEPHLGMDLRRWLVPSPEDEVEADEKLAETLLTQPALFVVEYALTRLWMSWGVQPAAFLGHSLGEYVAACLAGVMTLEEILPLVALRGRLAQSLAPGAMLSVSLSEEELAPLLPMGVEIAALNAPERSVASGPPEAIEKLRKELAGRGVEARPLDVRRSFHSPSVDAILDEWVEAVRGVSLSPPEIPYLSNLTGTWVTAEQATDPESWAAHLRRPVRFSSALMELLRDPRRVLLEVGPGQTLAALARRHVKREEPRTVLSSLPHRDDPGSSYEHLLGALGRLWLAGVEVAWESLAPVPEREEPVQRRRVPLPTYPFERQRYWLDAPKEAPGAVASPAESTTGSGIHVPLWKQALPPTPEPDGGALWVFLMDSDGLGPRLLQRLQEEKKETVAVVAGAGWSRITGSAFTMDPAAPDYDALLEALGETGRPLRLVHVWSLRAPSPTLPRCAGEGAPDLPQLAAALERRVDGPPVRVDVITSGAADPAGNGTLFVSPLPARMIDVEPPAPGSAAEQRLLAQLAGELSSPAAGMVALRGRTRWIESWEELPGFQPPRSTGRWIVTGELDGNAVALAESLAATPGSKVALIGPEEPVRTPSVGGRKAVDLGIDPDWIAKTERELASRLPPEGAAQVAAATDPLCASYIVHFLREAGLDVAPGRSLTLDDLRERLRVLPKYERFLRMLLLILTEDGIVSLEDETVRFLKSGEEVGSPETWRRDLEARFPQLRGLFELLDHCVRAYPRALAGEIEGLSVLYPEGSPELLQRASVSDGEGPGEDLPSSLLREILAMAAERRPGEALRILEVGAGQGLMTRQLLPALAGRDVEYTFTDVGRAFVLRAEKDAAAAGHRFFRFGVLDISRDPESQGYPPGTFHAVLGANVVHATPRIAETLGHLRSLLAPGGVLGLVEIVRQQRWSHMVWGLTDGWWSFEDAPLRTTSPLLDPESWKAVLAESGFVEAAVHTGESTGARADLALLLAQRPVEEAAAASGDAFFLRADLTEPESLAAALAEARRRLGKVAGCVYLAPAAPSPTLPRSAGEGARDKPGFEALCAPDPTVRPALAAAVEESGGAATVVVWDGSDPLAAEQAGAALLALAASTSSPAQAVISRRTPAAATLQAIAAEGATAGSLAGPVEPGAESGNGSGAMHDRPNLLQPYVAPRNDLELDIAAIWRKALGIERIGVNDNFMELGGDSLIGLQVVHALMARYDLGGRKFSLYETPTVAAIAQLLSGSGEEAAPMDQRSSRGERRRELRKNFKRTSR